MTTVRYGNRIGREDLLRDSGKHEALIGSAIAVAIAVGVVSMARATQDERLVAIESLQAGVEMTARILIVDFHRDVNFHTAERVDRFLEAVEVDFCIMRDGNARELRNDLDRVGRAADRVRRIELLLAARSFPCR